MIGIDITRLSRFKRLHFLTKLFKRYHIDGNSAMAAAKTWACLEALVKAKGEPFDFKKIKILFPQGQRPVIEDPENVLGGSYMLALSHEDDLVIAVAINISRG
jgi:phosphopantetheinyl transferase (holo-ACP synthase)